MDTKQAAQQVRDALKAHGWNVRMVSVRTDYFSMGSSLDVTIRDPRANAAIVERVALESQRIARDEITGEILSGGNRYVHVTHTREAEAALAARHLDALTAAVAEADANEPRTLCRVSESVSIVREGTNAYQLWPAEHVVNARSWRFDRHALRDIAYRIALMDADQQEPVAAVA